MTLLEEIDEGELSTSSRVLRTVVPGYDYRSQEQLKRTDETLREKLRQDLTQALRQLDDVHDRLYDADRTSMLERVTGLRDEFETMRRRVETGSSGGGAVRNVAVADESELVALIEYDAKLVDTSEALVDHTAVLADQTEDADLVDLIAQCERAISEFDRAFRERQDRLNGIR